MSVAFRRESDEEHLEPKFEIPIPPGPNLVTARGLALITDRIAACEAVLPALQDDSEIKNAKRDVRYWRTRHATAQLMLPAHSGRVEFGNRVTFRLNGAERTAMIVGVDEADPAQGLLSFSAPLIRAMMGAEPGETLPFGGKEDSIEIVSVG